MTVYIVRTRMAMPERCYAYDGLVSTRRLDRSKFSSFILRDGPDGAEYVTFADATRPAEISAMPLGWERYLAACAHEQAANLKLLELAKRVYPELEPVTTWPTLWVEIPQFYASHAERRAYFHDRSRFYQPQVSS